MSPPPSPTLGTLGKRKRVHPLSTAPPPLALPASVKRDNRDKGKEKEHNHPSSHLNRALALAAAVSPKQRTPPPTNAQAQTGLNRPSGEVSGPTDPGLSNSSSWLHPGLTPLSVASGSSHGNRIHKSDQVLASNSAASTWSAVSTRPLRWDLTQGESRGGNPPNDARPGSLREHAKESMASDSPTPRVLRVLHTTALGTASSTAIQAGAAALHSAASRARPLSALHLPDSRHASSPAADNSDGNSGGASLDQARDRTWIRANSGEGVDLGAPHLAVSSGAGVGTAKGKNKIIRNGLAERAAHILKRARTDFVLWDHEQAHSQFPAAKRGARRSQAPLLGPVVADMKPFRVREASSPSRRLRVLSVLGEPKGFTNVDTETTARPRCSGTCQVLAWCYQVPEAAASGAGFADSQERVVLALFTGAIAPSGAGANCTAAALSALMRATAMSDGGAANGVGDMDSAVAGEPATCIGVWEPIIETALVPQGQKSVEDVGYCLVCSRFALLA